MHDDDVLERLREIETRQVDVLAELVKLNAAVATLSERADAVVAEIGGAPPLYVRGERQTLRDRLHRLENDEQAARIAGEALNAARLARRQAWGTWQKVALFGFAFVGALTGVLRIFGVSG